MHTTVLPPIDPIAQVESDHRIANNLGLIAALLELDARVVEEAGGVDIAGVLDMTRRRIFAIANLHRRLYHSDRAGFVDLADYLEDMGKDLRLICQDSGRRRRLAIKSETIFLEADLAVSVGIIVAELVSNACKHAYADDETGEVRIILSRSMSGWQLVVEDDGIGFAQSPQRSTASLGAHLIAASAARLGATYVWQDASLGTRFTLWKDDIVKEGQHDAQYTAGRFQYRSGALHEGILVS